jgi:hypothetical protein
MDGIVFADKRRRGVQIFVFRSRKKIGTKLFNSLQANFTLCGANYCNIGPGHLSLEAIQ